MSPFILGYRSVSFKIFFVMDNWLITENMKIITFSLKLSKIGTNSLRISETNTLFSAAVKDSRILA